MAGKIPHNSPVKKVENFKNHMKMNSLCENELTSLQIFLVFNMTLLANPISQG